MNMPLPSSPGPVAELVRVARAKTLDSHEETERQQVRFQRTLILCFDGTANQYNNQNTNVVRLFSCLEKSHPKQLVYYQTGIGTYSTTKFTTPGMTMLSKAVDQGVALHLEEHVCGGYRFLQSNWKGGDKICIFGFSRGAYTARALAGMLHAVGLLPPSMPEQVEFAYKLYQNLGSGLSPENPGRNYKRDFCREVTVDFLGVWDTVASVGLIVPRTLPFSQSNSSVKIFRHAMALDERRVKFIPSLWKLSGVEKDLAKNSEWTIEKGAKDVTEPTASSTRHASVWLHGITKIILSWYFNLFIGWWAHPILDRLGFCKEEHSETPRTALVPREDKPPDVKEVWFAGDHCDVGGGHEKDDDKSIKPDENNIKYTPALSNIPLRWMIREFYEAGRNKELNIRWRNTRLARYGIFLPAIEYTNDDPKDASAILDDDKVRKERQERQERRERLLKVDLSQEPETVKFDTTEEVKKKYPRRAKFTRSKVFRSGVMIDLDFHDRDVTARHYDALWNWDNFSFSHIMGMGLWWFLEFIPYMNTVQNKKTNLWESKISFNLFRHRDIPRDNTEPAHLEKARGEWKEFLIKRSKPHIHSSVVERMDQKPDYRPRPWDSDEKLDKWIVAH